MEFSITLILLLTLLSACESTEDADSTSYIEIKPSYLRQTSSQDDFKYDINDYKNMEMPERIDIYHPSMSNHLPKDESSTMLDFLSSPINNILKSDPYLKKQFLMSLAGWKSRIENHKFQNHLNSNFANKRSLNILKERNEPPDSVVIKVPNRSSSEKGKKVDRLKKRGTCCTVGLHGKCFPCERNPFVNKDVTYEDLKEFASLPLTIVNLTHTMDREEICGNIDSKLFETDLRKFPRILPSWLLEIHTLGMCPFTLRKRYLGPNTFPSVIVEIGCLCKNSVCSKHGGDFRCTAVEYPIQTLVKDVHSEEFVHDIEFVTAACVCAQIPSSNAIDGNRYFIGE